jgi:hypothetical protein
MWKVGFGELYKEWNQTSLNRAQLYVKEKLQTLFKTNKSQDHIKKLSIYICLMNHNKSHMNEIL